MIRLIATDMDGTLLRKDGTIHPGMFSLRCGLAEKGIYFVIASGRPLFNLRNIFYEVQNDIGLIAFNGAWYEWKGESHPCAPVPPEVCRKVVIQSRKHPELDCVLDTAEKSYVENEDSLYLNWREAQGWTQIEDLLEVIEKRTIFRIKLSGAEEDVYPPAIEKLIPAFWEKAQIIRADRNGVDFSGLGNGKGEALNRIQKRLGVSPEETLVFGDYYNDISLFEYAACRVAPEDACSELKERATHIIGDHDSDSVYYAIETVYRKGELK